MEYFLNGKRKKDTKLYNLDLLKMYFINKYRTGQKI